MVLVSSNQIANLAHHPAVDAPASVLCFCADSDLMHQLQRRLASRCELVCAGDDSEALAAILGNNLAVAILQPTPAVPLSDAIRQELLRASPAVTLIILGKHASFDPRSWPDSSRVRFLPDPEVPTMLEQMVEDYVERHRLSTLEQTLMRELDRLQHQVNLLSPHREQNLQDTTSLLRLYHVVSGLSGLTTPREIGELLVSTAAGLMKSRCVSLLMPDPTRQYLTVVASIGLPAEMANRVRIPVGKPISGDVFARARSLLARGEDTPGWDQRADAELISTAPFVSLVMTGPEYPLGVLNVSDPVHPGAYTEESLTGLHAIVEAAAISLVNQIRGQERNDARDGIMMALAKLAESRDPETGAHLERVQNYCRVLAEALAGKPQYREIITSEFISTLIWSSPLHDIGKVGVPDHILLKPGQLTPEEFEIMKNHPIIGGETIRALIERGRRQDFLEMAMQIAYYHHEKYDGSGYPFGLAGESIPLPARIMALADVYDALTTARVYKHAMPHQQAVELILNGSGRQFDPEIVDAFINRERDFKKLATELADTNRGTSPRHLGHSTCGVGSGSQISSPTPMTVEAERPVS